MTSLKNITLVQWLAIVVAITAAVAGGATQLTDIFGSATSKIIVGLANLAGTIMSGVIAVLSGQSYIAQAVNNMKGVEYIGVNKDAPTFLAKMAVDPESKVEPTEDATATVVAKATE